MNRQTGLSVCMIVKNEESFIANCLRSVMETADELIVVDTGSADGPSRSPDLSAQKFIRIPGTGISVMRVMFLSIMRRGNGFSSLMPTRSWINVTAAGWKS